MVKKVTMDFETYSEAGYVLKDGKVTGKGLKRVGVPVYATHPSTEIVCLAYDLEGEVQLWVPHLSSFPRDLARWVELGGAIEAHNVAFERWIWNAVLARKFRAPPLSLAQTYCSMAKCRRAGLPPSLGEAALVVGGEQKDKRGDGLVRRLCVPTKWTKDKQCYRRQPWDFWDEYLALYEYCLQDVRAEKSLSEKVPDLTEYEREIWLTDQRINDRGILVDVDLLDAALHTIDTLRPAENSRLSELTQGTVRTVDQTKALAEWLTASGASTESVKEGALDELLDSDIPENCREVIKIRKSLAGANIKKLYTIKDQLSPDGRLRHQYVYCGAGQTGRWTSTGAQLQNLTAKGPPTYVCSSCGRVHGFESHCPNCSADGPFPSCDWGPENGSIEQAISDTLSGAIWDFWPDIVATLTGCLRALFIPKPGYKFVCCDFSSIEAMAAAELSGCEWRKEVFRTHGNIYAASASQATGTPLQEILEYKNLHGKNHPLRNTIGKVRELAGGYGGWVGAWKNFGAGEYFASDIDIKTDVLKFRSESPEIVEMWGGQFRQTGPRMSDGHPELYGLEGAAIQAIQNPGSAVYYRGIGYCVEGGDLLCRLPSGRHIRYHRPRLVPVPGKFGRPPTYSLVFWGYNTNPEKGPRGWIQMETYGGRLFENADQGTCADIQAEALCRTERGGWRPVLHTHDEVLAEVPEEWGGEDDLRAVLEQRPGWCPDWPIRADGWSGYRYRK